MFHKQVSLQWLSKQAEARRKTGFVVEDLRPEEQDPQWLKDKGEYVRRKCVLRRAVDRVFRLICFFRSDFFKAGNYLAAISAYTHGIKISDKMTTLYVNRSAAHYAIGNYYRCIDDSSQVRKIAIVITYAEYFTNICYVKKNEVKEYREVRKKIS